MKARTLKLQRPKDVSVSDSGEFFINIVTNVRTGGHYKVVCGYPINPKSLFCSIQPQNPNTTDAACFVRGVSWDNGSLYAYLEIIDGKKWLETGEIVYWDGPLTLQYCFHGQAGESSGRKADESKAAKKKSAKTPVGRSRTKKKA